MGKSTLALGDTVKLAGMIMSATAVTETVAVASVMPAALARIVAVPAVAPVTGTVADVDPAAIVTEAGTVAAAVLDELIANVSPLGGAGLASVNVRFWTAAPEIVSVAGEKLIDVVT